MQFRSVAAACLAATVLALAPSCKDEETETEPTPTPVVKVTPAPFGEPYEKLSDWHFFADALAQQPADDLVPYEVIAPLFSDYTTKWRFLYVPEGETVTYNDDDEWDFPVGTIGVKTFAYAADLAHPEGERRIMETRVLVREPDGWKPSTYVWNEDQTEATLIVGGKFVPVDFIDLHGEAVHTEYRVPNTNECQDCHHRDDDQGQPQVVVLGPKTRQLDRDHDYGDGPENQIDHYAALGWFASPPTASSGRERLVDPYGDGDVSLRARSYFDANCSGCHKEGGSATDSDLRLGFHETDPETSSPATWGVCKIPTSTGGATCGNTYDVVPQDPDASVIVCRMSSTAPDERMPPLGSRIVHEEGLALVREWIESLDPATCSPN